jgi:hypothetical protein
VYWCTFTDTIAPEMGEKRPVVIVSLNNKIGQTSTVVPLTSKPDEMPSEHRVSIKNPNPNGGPEVWAIPPPGHHRQSLAAFALLGQQVQLPCDAAHLRSRLRSDSGGTLEKSSDTALTTLVTRVTYNPTTRRWR